ncbi:DNA-packaging protein [Nakamurella sp. PAMC28650]|uniref:DNA-packaging protein n=1 Tax=Nakamurella sp. PAMC28650 TaxID=2762325 RepID=UPI00164DD52E|nr:DNA-packaging protein [Nakamurella sp. PAMC28650]QNK82585.1 DNA-packaging protein [Nakamurella sp. PAMC28650]
MADKHPGGRPTKYTPELLKKAQGYLKQCVDTKEVVRTGNSGQVIWTVKLPSVAGLAIYLKVARQTVYDWAETYPQFSDILDEILAEQEQRLIDNGLAGNYNSAIAKLVLGKHGYQDKLAQEHTGRDGAPIAFIDMAKSGDTDS